MVIRQGTCRVVNFDPVEWNLQFDVTKHMSVFLAYLSVILIWSTTPLAIKWSGEGHGYLFGATGRMSIGLVYVLLAMAVLHQSLPWHRKARLAYLGAALHIYGAMLAVYWAAQFIPSGWVAVVFGLTPMLTAVMAALWLGNLGLLGWLLAPKLTGREPCLHCLSGRGCHPLRFCLLFPPAKAPSRHTGGFPSSWHMACQQVCETAFINGGIS